MAFLLCKTDFTAKESNAVEGQTKTIEAILAVIGRTISV